MVALLQSKEMRQLRLAAQHKLDLSDAFEESCGKGLNAAMGEMARNRFGATLGGLFGGELSAETLKEICDVYGCGDVDHRTGLHKEVWFKQFANGFDGIAPGARARARDRPRTDGAAARSSGSANRPPPEPSPTASRRTPARGARRWWASCRRRASARRGCAPAAAQPTSHATSPLLLSSRPTSPRSAAARRQRIRLTHELRAGHDLPGVRHRRPRPA